MSNSLKIAQVSPRDIAGGAEKIAFDLFQSYMCSGYDAKLFVGDKLSTDPNVITLPNDKNRNLLARFWASNTGPVKAFKCRIPGAVKLARYFTYMSEPRRLLDELCGHEDFNYPGTRCLMSMAGWKPDIVHCHNLHGGYFDLRALPEISHRVPVIITLHDAWTFSGHCAHSFDCDRWKSGCGNCPYLSIYPRVRRDATAYNYKVKDDIYKKSQLYITAPSKWLLDRAKLSIMRPGIVQAKLIPNGTDLKIFHPGDRLEARRQLKLPEDAYILLFIANSIRKNIWKDYETLRNAFSLLAKSYCDKQLIFLALGEESPPEKIGNAWIKFIPYEKNPAIMSLYYQASDVYVHAARVETFGNTIVEAMACGIPVVATAVGGIPEIVDPGVTGYLTPCGDAGSMAERIDLLLSDEARRDNMGERAAQKAAREYDLEMCANRYLCWYREILGNRTEK